MEEKIADRLTRIRKEHGYTRQRLSEELGVPYATIRNYELCTREPGHSYIVAIAKKFNLTTDYVLGITDEKTSPTPEQSDAGEVEKVDRLLTDLLVGWGYIQSGEDITELDAEFLISWVRGLNAWFKQKGQSG